jgi:hypothetical protein
VWKPITAEAISIHSDHLLIGGLEQSPEVKLVISCPEKIFDAIGIFEVDNVRLACVMPEIVDLSSDVEEHAHRPGCADVAESYRDAIAIVRCKYLPTVNSIFHLADVLTPIGRTLSRDTEVAKASLTATWHVNDWFRSMICHPSMRRIKTS